MDDKIVLPEYRADDFRLTDPPECDLVMKGGITSGIVYPYAVLELATKYRFKSVGGTSAGAIAAAFAAAAEYARRNGRPEGFMLLKQYCDRLPDILLSLFQPAPEFKAAFDSGKAAMARGGPGPIVGDGLRAAAPWAALGAGLLAVPSALLGAGGYASVLAMLLGGLLGAGYGAWRWANGTYIGPVKRLLAAMPEHDFGFCTGLTQPGNDGPALTDWMHRALQHIAFGDPDHPEPLTFAHLWGPDPKAPLTDFNVVTTNLSMRRPHTLPRLGVPAGFEPAKWDRLFPKPVMDHIYAKSRQWTARPGTWGFPKEGVLPVVVAVRMSLSFPVLFTAVPLVIEDFEFKRVVDGLGGKAETPFRRAHFSDGGISSNFPIHMFDALLPRRPTFAFSLDDLPCDADQVKSRIALPKTARDGIGVRVQEIGDLKSFAGLILNSAKDWQDQLLSEITGQRERIAHIYLTPKEGGLNLDMPADLSRRLMHIGYLAGKKFKDGEFSFDEHRWRRSLVLYGHLRDRLVQARTTWRNGFAEWHLGYLDRIGSYKKLTAGDRRRIHDELGKVLDASDVFDAEAPIADSKLPGMIGAFKVGPKY